MLPSATYAIYCQSIEDAAEIAEVIQSHAPRLFIVVGGEKSGSSTWMHPRDAVLFVNPGADGSKATAMRCAMLFAPSYMVVFIDGTIPINVATEDIAMLISEANQYGYAELEQHWAITKLYAVENGFPGFELSIPPSPDSQNLNTSELVTLLTDLVPMFEVCFEPAFGVSHKNIRTLLEPHITTYDTVRPSTYFVSNGDLVDTARKQIKPTGKVVCFHDGPEGYDREIVYEHGVVRVYTSL